MLETIRYNLVNLVNFRGRQTRAQFWPYAAVIIFLTIVGTAAVFVPPIVRDMGRMQRIAAAHPELATIRSGPGTYSITIQGDHPELMPDMGGMLSSMNVVFVAAALLLAAAVARRLHDCGKSGFWGLLPIPFIVFASFAMPRIFTQNPPDTSLFIALFFNNLFYLASLALLVVLLCGATKQEPDHDYADPVR